MSPEETDLTRLLVALPGWTWRAGMLARTREGMVLRILGRPNGGATRPAWTDLPDLHDPATAGVLLGMLPPWHQTTRHEDVYEVTVYDCPPIPDAVVHSGPHGTAKWWTVSGASLGVAAARALVAIGRAS